MPEQVIKSVEEMHVLARAVASTLQGGEVLLLSGELGAGKTTFTQGIAKALGITADVTSPTFTIVGEYPVMQHPSITTLVHVDLYRLADEKAATDMAVRDVLEQAHDPTRLTVIEWAENLGDTLPSRSQKISFQHSTDHNSRLVTF